MSRVLTPLKCEVCGKLVVTNEELEKELARRHYFGFKALVQFQKDLKDGKKPSDRERIDFT